MNALTCAAPPTLLEALLECTAYIEEMRVNPERTKEDVLDAWERRMGLVIGRLVAAPTCTSFCLWRRRDD